MVSPFATNQIAASESIQLEWEVRTRRDLPVSPEDLLIAAQSNFHAMEGYRTTLRSMAADGEQHIIRYSYRKPGWVRMEFEQPHKGVVLIYDPRARKVRIWPFGLHGLPAPSLAPDNPMLRSRSGQRIDRSDIGVLLTALFELRAHGSVVTLGDTAIASRCATGLCVSGAIGVGLAGAHRFHVWLANDGLFPLKVESFDNQERLIEVVDMSDAEINVAFPARFFTP